MITLQLWFQGAVQSHQRVCGLAGRPTLANQSSTCHEWPTSATRRVPFTTSTATSPSPERLHSRQDYSRRWSKRLAFAINLPCQHWQSTEKHRLQTPPGSAHALFMQAPPPQKNTYIQIQQQTTAGFSTPLTCRHTCHLQSPLVYSAS